MALVGFADDVSVRSNHTANTEEIILLQSQPVVIHTWKAFTIYLDLRSPTRLLSKCPTGVCKLVCCAKLRLMLERTTDASEDETPAAPSAPVLKKPVKSKWEGEDEEDDGPVVRAPCVCISTTP